MAQRKKIVARKKISVAEQEELLNALQQQKATEKVPADTEITTRKPAKKTKVKTQRVTVDFPVAMYDQMKVETEENGQTLRGFIVSLVRQHLAEKNR